MLAGFQSDGGVYKWSLCQHCRMLGGSKQSLGTALTATPDLSFLKPACSSLSLLSTASLSRSKMSGLVPCLSLTVT
ncbi:hypothetical protein DPMN_159636 [Dreissena polymorpha]|uniref:Uncharacterized protein n=1 Tax=Dreissena polymorpha TaxID=45954 RepID=A0A9D4IQX4_DREPO|nr:hypothetical protein DPMN_159636 [Dreissena polymorpha]